MKIFCILIFVFIFSSCTKINSFDLSSEFASFNAGSITSDNMSIDVDMNEPKNFNIGYKVSETSGLTDIQLSFSKDLIQDYIESPESGKFKIIDQSSMLVRYEPAFNFKGRDAVYAYIHHKINGKKNITRIEIAAVVTNPNPESTVFINTLTVTVEKDSVGKEFTVAPPVGQKRNPKFSFINSTTSTLLQTNSQQGGVVFITDAATGKFKYIPPKKYTGVDSTTAYFVHLVEDKETISQFTINFIVINPNPDQAMTANDVAIDTDMNVSKTFSVNLVGKLEYAPTLSFDGASKNVNVKTTTSNNKVTIVDQITVPNMPIFKFEPAAGFRGTDTVTVYIHQTVETIPVVTNFRITFIVKNPNPESVVYLNTLTVTVNKDSVDTPFNVAVAAVGTERNPKFSFAASSDLTTATTASNGTVTITNAQRGEFKYTPAASFKGLDTVNAYFSHLVEGSPVVTQFAINFLVINPDPESEMVAGDLAIETQFGTEKTFSVVIVNSSPKRHAKISFDANNDSIKTVTTGSGSKLEVIDNDNSLFKYTPNIGFRGIENVTVYLHQTVEGIATKTDFKITFIVRNPNLLGRPALALRATECTMCHAQIKGNLITDIGFDSDSAKSFFMGYKQDNTLMSGHTDGGHGYYAPYSLAEKWAPSYGRNTISGSILVPNATIRSGMTSVLEGLPLIDTNLASYLRLKRPENTVEQKSKITIGAPDKSLYINAKYLPSPLTYNYFKEDAGVSLNLDGLSSSIVNGIRVFRNDPTKTFKCEGDLVLDGSLLLHNLNIDTDTGCRFYVSGTVLISGPINYVYKSRRTNIQITADSGILHGLCAEPKRGNGWGIAFKNKVASQLFSQLSTNFSALSSGVSLSCERNVSHQSLLLNSAWVSSRYNANYKGSIIAEAAIMSLGAFYFEYDPVFDTTPIFPLVNQSTYLEIKD